MRPGYHNMKWSITAGHCCAISFCELDLAFKKKKKLSLKKISWGVIEAWPSLFQEITCIQKNLWRHREEDECLLPGNPEQPWGSWEQREIWVLLPSPWSALAPPETPTVTVDKCLHSVTASTTSMFIWTEAVPALCGRWACPICCCSWWCPPSLQQISSPLQSSAAISWKVIWLHSEPAVVFTLRKKKEKKKVAAFGMTSWKCLVDA